ncbi:unnamed protein product [Pipistrellus nathusii]|uniref:Uncharacterized protein n=1 Tax=Pipistrellus nathusii TaxID=59473 RepID=A0ABN9ZHR7_PIPNA
MRRPLSAGPGRGPAWDGLLLTGACVGDSGAPRLRDRGGRPSESFHPSERRPTQSCHSGQCPPGMGICAMDPSYKGGNGRRGAPCIRSQGWQGRNWSPGPRPSPFHQRTPSHPALPL